MSTTVPSGYETKREHRVLSQMLSMHALLRDRYSRLALSVDVILLMCSVLFCATRFARDDLFEQLGVTAQVARLVLGLVSVLAFFASLVALRVDWKGRAARHTDAVRKLTAAMALFGQHRYEDGTWPETCRLDLHRAYWDAMNSGVPIPDRQFLGLKARHLRKLEVSKLMDSVPGCPAAILHVVVMSRSLMKALRKSAADRRGTQT